MTCCFRVAGYSPSPTLPLLDQVVIKSTQMYQGGAKGYAELPKSALLQMMGRAGRPQFDTHGVVAIMVRRCK